MYCRNVRTNCNGSTAIPNLWFPFSSRLRYAEDARCGLCKAVNIDFVWWFQKNVLNNYLNPMAFEFWPDMITAYHIIKFDFKILILAAWYSVTDVKVPKVTCWFHCECIGPYWKLYKSHLLLYIWIVELEGMDSNCANFWQESCSFLILLLFIVY